MSHVILRGHWDAAAIGTFARRQNCNGRAPLDVEQIEQCTRPAKIARIDRQLRSDADGPVGAHNGRRGDDASGGVNTGEDCSAFTLTPQGPAREGRVFP